MKNKIKSVPAVLSLDGSAEMGISHKGALIIS